MAAFSELAVSMGEAAAQWQGTWPEFFAGQTREPNGGTPPQANFAALAENVANMKFDPAKALEAQAELLRDFQTLWMNTTARLTGGDTDPVIEPAADDHRFKDAAWSENPAFDFLKQSYLLNARWLQRTLQNVEGLDADAARKLEFFSRQIVDAMAPTNFAMTNPRVLREIADSKGESIVRGLQNLADDAKDGRDAFRPRHTDMNAFTVGEDLATSPARIVEDDPELLDRLSDPAYKARPERAILFQVEAWDVNCPQHITRRFTEAQVSEIVAPLQGRIAGLEAEIAALRRGDLPATARGAEIPGAP